jgi:hypothetical protein
MAIDTTASLPPWAIQILSWFALAVSGIFVGIYGWIQRKYVVKVDSHDKVIESLASVYATIEMVANMEDKIPSLVTRIELMAFMQDMKEERLRMHKENLDNGMATRTDIRAVHERVDALFRNGHAR